MRRMLVWTMLATSLAGAAFAEANSSVGRKVEPFSLRDYQGKERSLKDWSDAKAIVVVFLGTECPLARLYGPRLNDMNKELGPKGVVFVGIDSNQQDSLAEIAAYARNHGVEFPLLKDPGNVVADAMGARRTPEAFVLDGAGTIRYQGRIDDQYGVGFQKPTVSKKELADAIEDVIADRELRVAKTEAPGCLIGRVRAVDPKGSVTYSKHIAPILQKRCAECHREGEAAPFPMTSYSEIAGWAETILEVVDAGRMPPWLANPQYGHFRNDPRLTDEEKQLLATWVANGAPEGDPKDLPAPRVFHDGWGIPKPDEVIYMREEPFTVPAQGVVEYKYFTVDPGWTEDKLIRCAEARPGNRAVVHHIIVFFKPPKATFLSAIKNGVLGGYAPGMPAVTGREGMAVRVPAGSKLIFQMHYTPNGEAQDDRSCLGVVFADPKEVKHEIKADVAINVRLSIPPGADNHEVTSQYVCKADTKVISMTPHMHLRGKSFRYEAMYPDGKSEILLDVPRYDFNWQLRYELEEPKLLPKGTKIFCTAHYDNSENNLANPDPSKVVRWGDQTWEEMMIGWFTATEEGSAQSSAPDARSE